MFNLFVNKRKNERSGLRSVFVGKNKVPDESESDGKSKHDSNIALDILSFVAKSIEYRLAAEILCPSWVEFFAYFICRTHLKIQ